MTTVDSEKLKKYQECLLKDGFVILPLLDRDLIYAIEKVISPLQNNTEKWFKMQRDKWHEIVKERQEMINDLGFLERMIKSQAELIKRITQEESLAWVNVLKLRAVRPFSETPIGDHVPFHRETLYADNSQVRYQFNLWSPISGSASASGLQYIPGTHCILDEALVTEKPQNHPTAVQRYSAGHAIGYPYQPKIITNMEQLTSFHPKTAKVPIGSCILFSSMLIHGNGINNTCNTRFSVDTGFIPLRRLNKNKNIHATRHKQHYRVL